MDYRVKPPFHAIWFTQNASVVLDWGHIEHSWTLLNKLNGLNILNTLNGLEQS